MTEIKTLDVAQMKVFKPNKRLIKIMNTEVRTMCGRYTIFTEEENIEIREIINHVNERFKDTEEIIKMKTGEIFPTNTVPVITAESNNKTVVNLFKWGFPNFKQASGVIINARSETLEEKQTFKKILQTKRCLIPASGFYEWKLIEGKKVKHLIRTANQPLFYMAGLFNSYKDKDGNPYTAFVIITTDANKEMSEIHTRMPVILTKEETDLWLLTDPITSDSLKSLLLPYKDKISLNRVG